MSDRWGRVKTMVVALLIYSGFTGLSGLARNGYDFMIYRFLVGLGRRRDVWSGHHACGGERPCPRPAAGPGLASDALGMRKHHRLAVEHEDPAGPGRLHVRGMSGWRIMFFVGILPSLLVVPIVLVLREPERWKEAKRRAAASTDKSTTLWFDPGHDPSSRLATEPARRRVPGTGRHGRALGHRLLLAGTDLHGAQGPAAAHRRYRAWLWHGPAGRRDRSWE